MSAAADESNDSLASTYHAADTLREQLSAGTLPSADHLPRLIALYTRAAELASRLALFSPNETLDDIATAELQYLLIDYFLADALFKQPSAAVAANEGEEGGGSTARRAVVLRARETWERFLRRIDAYELLRKADARLLERYTEDRDAFEVGAGLDAAGRRAAKISRFQEEKVLKSQLAQLRGTTQRGAPATTTTMVDEDVVRRLHLLHIALCVHDTFQALEFASLELQMLRMAPTMPHSRDAAATASSSDTRQRSSSADKTYSDRLDNALTQRTRLTDQHAPILDRGGKPLRPFTLLDKRAQLQDGVFRPDHSLPTMSIDEYLAEEKRRGGIIEGGGSASGVREETDPDDCDKVEAEMYKARQWDEFKEDNPRGSGNTINRG